MVYWERMVKEIHTISICKEEILEETLQKLETRIDLPAPRRVLRGEETSFMTLLTRPFRMWSCLTHGWLARFWKKKRKKKHTIICYIILFLKWWVTKTIQDSKEEPSSIIASKIQDKAQIFFINPLILFTQFSLHLLRGWTNQNDLQELIITEKMSDFFMKVRSFGEKWNKP